MSVAFGVQNNGDVGTTASDLRGMLWWKWEAVGIVNKYDLAFPVTGSGLHYDVGEGLAICARGSGYGYVEAYWPGGSTENVSANSSSNPRIDAVWVIAHDVTQGDPDNLVAVGVTQGTPAASPTAPSIPTSAILIATMLLPAGATSTSAASVQSKGEAAVPWGASLGILVDKVDTTNSSTAIASGYHTYASGTFTLPTARYVDVKRVFTLASLTSADASVYTRVLIDGAQVSQGEVRCYGSPTLATSQYMENTVFLEAGTHTVQAQMQKGVNTARKYWARNQWAGQTLQVVDAGVA